MRDALRLGTLRWTYHQGLRREQRDIPSDDVEHALGAAGLPQRSLTNPGEAWVFVGETEDGAKLKIVVGYDKPYPNVVTVMKVKP